MTTINTYSQSTGDLVQSGLFTTAGTALNLCHYGEVLLVQQVETISIYHAETGALLKPALVTLGTSQSICVVDTPEGPILVANTSGKPTQYSLCCGAEICQGVDQLGHTAGIAYGDGYLVQKSGPQFVPPDYPGPPNSINLWSLTYDDPTITMVESGLIENLPSGNGWLAVENGVLYVALSSTANGTTTVSTYSLPGGELINSNLITFNNNFVPITAGNGLIFATD